MRVIWFIAIVVVVLSSPSFAATSNTTITTSLNSDHCTVEVIIVELFGPNVLFRANNA